MHRSSTFIAGLLLAFGAGWIAGIFVPQAFSPRLSTGWFALSFPSENEAISYSAEEIFKSDISMPDVKALTGSAKFVNDGMGEQSVVRLGYKVKIEASPLTQAKVSEKYREDGMVDASAGKEVTLLPRPSTPQDSYRLVPLEPTKEAIASLTITYEARFYFTLKDKDGFVLLELTSKPHSIKLGKTNSFHSLVDDTVPIGLALRTSEVILGTNIRKCFR